MQTQPIKSAVLVGDTVVDSWADLLTPDENLSGKVTMLDEDRWLLEPALKTPGYSVNTTDPDQLQEAVDLSIQAKSTLLGYDAETFYSKLVSGEAVAVQGWDGWCNYGTAEDANIAFVIPSEGSQLNSDNLCIPVGAPHPLNAHMFINNLLDGEVGKKITETILYPTPNAAAKALMPDDYKNNPVIFPAADLLAKSEYASYNAQLQPLYEEAFTRIRAA